MKAVQLNPAAINALKRALSAIYWYKPDLKSFVTKCVSNQSVLLKIDWEGQKKRQSVSELVDGLHQLNDTKSLVALCLSVCQMTDFSHLDHLEDASLKKQEAKTAVEQLKKMVQPHEDELKAKKVAQENKRRAEEDKKVFQDFMKELAEIKQDFYNLLSNRNAQSRGYQLEKIMHRLFGLNDLDPKASFKVFGEQIDGAFTLDNTEYLFEAKWQKELINKADLTVFEGKVKAKLENTLGLFLSIEGFSSEGVEAFQSKGSAIILMDGSDLVAVLDDRIKLHHLINRKKQVAAREGKIFVTYAQMIQK